MAKRMVLLAGALALALGLAHAGPAAAAVVTGRVVQVDPATQVIVLDNNRTVRLTSDTVVLVDSQPVSLTAVQPGQTVVIQSAPPVVTAPSAVVTTPPPVVAGQPGGTVVVQSSTPAMAQQTVYGRVTDVDGGEVNIEIDGDDFDVKLPREVAAQLRRGDRVRLDLTFLR